MLRRLQAFLLLSFSTAALSASAQPSTDEPMPADGAPSDQAKAPAAAEEVEMVPPQPQDEPSSKKDEPVHANEAAAAAPPGTGEKPEEKPSGWEMSVSGYFRAPLTIGISPRADPNDLAGEKHTQFSYGPNRTVDSNYYSFAYTRLQEQDWVEVFVHAKRKHVEAVVGWMGYWFQASGFRNPDAAWAPGIAYLKLDTDIDAGAVKPNIALTAGAFWPRFGYFEKYDTYTLGQFRQIGEQVKLTVPFTNDLHVALFQGFGGGRDGSFVYQINPPIYGAKTGLDLIAYGHAQVSYKKVVDVGLHYNHEWTRDPNLFQQAVPGKSYTDARQAHVTVIGGEASVRAPFAGRFWVSPSYITVKNGWALGANGGTEVMHSLGGAGLATNYLAWTNSPADSTGTGSMFNLGFLYENSLSSVLGKAPGSSLPDVTLNVFGLMMNANLDLPAGSVIPQDQIKQFKYGADVTLQPLTWLGVTARFDEVNYDLDHPGYIFSAITGRLTFSSHYLSGESVYLQYSRYRYGESMVLAGKWPWGTPLVAGSDIQQGGPYSGDKPDMDVVKLQASIAF